MENNLKVVRTSQVYKFLTSKDPKVVMMCARRLRDNVEARKQLKMPVLKLYWTF